MLFRPDVGRRLHLFRVDPLICLASFSCQGVSVRGGLLVACEDVKSSREASSKHISRKRNQPPSNHLNNHP
jgi:hypothetical protein